MNNSRIACLTRILFAALFAMGTFSIALHAQDSLGAITGTVKDSSDAAVPETSVKATNIATNLQVTERTDTKGSYLIPNLPVGTYTLSFTKDGFETETHTQVLVNGGRTTTITAPSKWVRLQPRWKSPRSLS